MKVIAAVVRLLLAVEGASDGCGDAVATGDSVTRVTGWAGADGYVVTGVAHGSYAALVGARRHTVVVDAVLVIAAVGICAAFTPAAV